MPKSGDECERRGKYVDEHGHVVEVHDGDVMPRCANGDTWWWHEDLPVARHMLWESARRASIMARAPARQPAMDVGPARYEPEPEPEAPPSRSRSSGPRDRSAGAGGWRKPKPTKGGRPAAKKPKRR